MQVKQLSGIFMLSCMLIVFGFSSRAQQTAVPLPIHSVHTVDFSAMVAYEQLHPIPMVQRAIEQGEDKDADFVFTPKAVGPGAVTFTIPPNSHQSRASINSPTPTVSFNGTQDNGTLIPPDIRGAVGPNHVMETNNQEFKIFNKTGTLISTLSITTFFSASGGSGYFDPHVVYDANNGRFIACIDGNVSNGHGGLFVAVSQTNDPTGSWYVYSFDAVGTTSDFIDYPLLGYNNNWVVVTANDFTSNTTAVGKIYVMNRASLYSGTLGTVSTFTDANAFTLAPAQTYDNTQNTEYLVQDYNGSSSGSGYMQVCTVTGTATAPVYTSGATIGVTQPWSETQVQAKQSGVTNTLDNGDTRVGNAVYRNGSLWFCHTVFLPATTPTHSAVDWWQINPATPSVQQFGRLEDATGSKFYFYPSINVNPAGDFLLGFCQSSSTTYASASYAFHAAADAVNTLENLYSYKTGLAGYFKDFGSGRNRYGDYTGTAIDPTNNSFWNFSEFAGTGNNWGTVICNVPASSTTTTCNAPTGMTTSAITSSSATFSWTAATGATSYNVQYRIVGAATWTTGTSTTTSFSTSGLTASSNYEWQVQTVCSSGSSAFTASTTFTTSAVAACNAPTGMATSAITSSSATFSWTAATGANSYNVQYRIVGSTTWTTGTSTTASFSASGLTASSNYEWQVQTVCSSGSSAFTASTTFTTSAAATCGVPSGLASGSITTTGATLSWTAVSGATSYSLQYKLATATAWTSVTGITATSKALTGLTCGSSYQYQVLSVCSSGSSAYSATSTFSTSACTTVTYCGSAGGSTAYEYINNITIGSINNTSGNNNGYANYTTLNTNLTGGAATTIKMTPGFTGSAYTEHWTVWIDYNHNGVFTDAGEKVTTGTGTSLVSKSFTVPTTALNGATRMRVQMAYGTTQTNSCATFTEGEVEDYTVTIVGNAHSPVYANGDIQVVNPTLTTITELSLYPNPAQNNFTVEFVNTLETTMKLTVYNLEGQRLISYDVVATEGYNSYSVETEKLSNGIYIFELEGNGATQRRKITIAK